MIITFQIQWKSKDLNFLKIAPKLTLRNISSILEYFWIFLKK